MKSQLFERMVQSQVDGHPQMTREEHYFRATDEINAMSNVELIQQIEEAIDQAFDDVLRRAL